MASLSSFESSLGSKVRFVEFEGKHYANGFDCAKSLGFSNPSRDIQNNVWKEYRFKFNGDQSVGQPGWWLNEYGVHQLLFASQHPKAVEFQRWVFEEVLPKLRASGGYIMPTATSAQLEALHETITQLQGQVKQVLASSGSAYMPCRLFAERIWLRDPSLNTLANEKKGDYPAKCRSRVQNAFWNDFVDGFLCPSDIRNVRFHWFCREVGFEPQWIVPEFGLDSQYSHNAQFPIWLMVWFLKNVFVPERNQRGDRTAYCNDFADKNRINLKDVQMPEFREILELISN
jgi:prophage antirepressor-like protein